MHNKKKNFKNIRVLDTAKKYWHDPLIDEFRWNVDKEANRADRRFHRKLARKSHRFNDF